MQTSRGKEGFCISLISDKASPCRGQFRMYKITGWAGLVGMCDKHLKEYMTENKLPTYTAPRQSKSSKGNK